MNTDMKKTKRIVRDRWKMKGKRVIAGILLAGILAVTLSGCKNTDNTKEEPEKPVITLGSDNYPPYNYLKDANIQTTDEFCKYMKKKYELSAYADHKITLMTVDSEGRYYTEDRYIGLFRDLDYFEDNPEQISFVFDSMTDNQSEMVLFETSARTNRTSKRGRESCNLLFWNFTKYGTAESLF